MKTKIKTSVSDPAASDGIAAEPHCFPASSTQQRVWFMEQLQPGRPLYNVPVAVRIEGPLDAAAIEGAVNDVVRRHESLRTSFRLEGAEPVQIVAPALTVKLTRTSLVHLPAETRETHACRIASEEALRCFDLQCLPLLRVRLLRLADTNHILILTVHHIVFDGWSCSLFFRELGISYAARNAGRTPNLPELPVQYGDFTVWQHERIASHPSWLAWWKKRLTGSPPSLELPTDRPRPAVHAGRGRVESLDIPESVREAFQPLQRSEQATLFMTHFAAFLVLLHRYTDQTDILVGTPSAGRTTAETEGLIGLFMNTLVLRGDISGEPTFRQLLRRVRAGVIEALAHEEAPFDKLVEQLRPRRNLGHAPLFQVMFAHERAPLDPVDWPGLRLTQLELDAGSSKFDLTLYLVESARGLFARVEYDSDLFDASTIRRLLAHYVVILRSAAADPDRRVNELPLLTDAERKQLIVEWNDTHADYPRDQTVHGLIAEQAARTPDAVAVEAGEQRMTYRRLEEDSNRLAQQLCQAGVRRGVLVGICVDRSPAMLVGLLGILKAGGAYVPLDPTYPRERLIHMLEDSQTPVVLTQRNWLEFLPRSNARFIHLDEDQPPDADRELDSDPNAAQLPASFAARPSSPAYVIYTSGSTGRPKGVAISHRAVVNFLCSMRRIPGITRNDVMLAVTTLSFDIAALELYLPLTVGARVALATREQTMDAPQMISLLTASRATVMQATPSMWRMLLSAGWTGSRTLRILCGGEDLPRDLADELLKRSAELWNLYGPTETTIWSSVARVEPGTGPVVIGRPIANTRLHILDRTLQPTPINVPGELFIGGDGLAIGYLYRPELTKEKFIRDPFDSPQGRHFDSAQGRHFDSGPDARLYCTGDLAHRRPNGDIELLGRLDHQVKIRGYRIELGEIEVALRRLPEVREAVVTATEDEHGDRRLIAYVVADPASAAPAALRRGLRETLPEYMLPTAFVFLERLPLTPNGKIDRRALPPPEKAAPQQLSSGIMSDKLESSIAAIWSEALKIENPGVNDNFFDIGGHSLRVAQVQTLLHTRLGIDLPMLAFFQYPTIRSLARRLRENQENGSIHKPAEQRARLQRVASARRAMQRVRMTS